MRLNKIFILSCLFLFPSLLWAHAKTLSLLTYNVWMVDMPFGLVSQDIEARAAAIPAAVAKTGADIVALQEVWPDREKKKLAAEFKKNGYPYSYFEDLPVSVFLRGLFGNGLLLVSKYPIETSTNRDERLVAYTGFTRRDEYFAHKGALHIVVDISGWGKLNVYDTHLGAESYVPELGQFDQQHEADRQKQAQELFDFVLKTKGENPVALMGDFNSYSKSLKKNKFEGDSLSDYQRLTCSPSSSGCLNLTDSFESLHPEDMKDVTINKAENPYVDSAFLYKNSPPPRTIDYIFISKSPQIKILESSIVMTEHLKISNREKELPLSDHYGVLTRINLD